mmetsp:Transcript_82994/g.165683  ORF Transcript_82994/g.165683 Transcript_82994/m.165683 type:complete len:232 (-) Transcript_82994:230-925(-)
MRSRSSAAFSSRSPSHRMLIGSRAPYRGEASASSPLPWLSSGRQLLCFSTNPPLAWIPSPDGACGISSRASDQSTRLCSRRTRWRSVRRSARALASCGAVECAAWAPSNTSSRALALSTSSRCAAPSKRLRVAMTPRRPYAPSYLAPNSLIGMAPPSSFACRRSVLFLPTSLRPWRNISRRFVCGTTHAPSLDSRRSSTQSLSQDLAIVHATMAIGRHRHTAGQLLVTDLK